MTLRSMTGLGTAECDGVSIEVRSVNHRHLDVRLNVPESWRRHESALNKLVRQSAKRGSVTLTIASAADTKTTIDFSELEERLAQWTSVADHLGRDEQAPLTWMLSGVTARPAAADVSTDLFECVEEALRSWDAERAREGEALARHIRALIVAMRGHLQAIQDSESQANQLYQERLRRRIEGLLGDHELDEVRLLQEVALMAERRDIAEERVRIAAHLDAVELSVDRADTAGRKLGFIAQELLREVNTIGSKAQDLAMTEHVVALKVLIEQLREQVLNVE